MSSNGALIGYELDGRAFMRMAVDVSGLMARAIRLHTLLFIR